MGHGQTCHRVGISRESLNRSELEQRSASNVTWIRIAAMDRADIEVLQTIEAWQATAIPGSLVTVVETWGTSPRPIGAMMAVSSNGQSIGSVSGGCVEEELIERLRSGPPATSEKVSYGVTNAQAARYGLACGGMLDVLIEPVRSGSWAKDILAAMAARRPVARRLELASGAVTIETAADTAELEFDGETLIQPFLPRWRMIITGAGHLSAVTARLALELGYDVLVTEPRAQYRDSWPNSSVSVSATMPDDLVREIKPDRHTVLLALTHDPKIDDLLLLEALPSEAFYVGALGSKRTNASRRERLRQHFGVPDEQLRKLHGPIGLDLNSRRVPEIALAILAEVTALRNGAAVVRVPAE